MTWMSVGIALPYGLGVMAAAAWPVADPRIWVGFCAGIGRRP